MTCDSFDFIRMQTLPVMAKMQALFTFPASSLDSNYVTRSFMRCVVKFDELELIKCLLDDFISELSGKN